MTTFKQIIDNGPTSNRINIVIIGDGYSQTELVTKYPGDYNKLNNDMFLPGPLNEPFNNYSKYFNVKDPVYLSQSIGAEINVEIQRNFQYYIFKVISPIILILLVCWSVFWIHPKELESKLTITIICLLSLIAYNFVIDEDLPKLSYLTIIDYIILLSYLFATVPNFLSIYSYQKWMKKKSQWKIVDAKSRIYWPILYLTLVFLIIFINSVNNPNTAAFLGFLS